VDAKQHAVGLIFGGMAEVPESLKDSKKSKPASSINVARNKPQRVESYGVANPISEVLDRLKIDLLV
jgi:hypothetical protein